MLVKQPITILSTFGELSSAYWADEDYFAALYVFQGVARLSIGRADASETPFSWEELQRIKTECGFGEVDAVEVYPQDRDVVNTANIRHLYLMPTPLSFAMRHQPILQSSGAENGKS